MLDLAAIGRSALGRPARARAAAGPTACLLLVIIITAWGLLLGGCSTDTTTSSAAPITTAQVPTTEPPVTTASSTTTEVPETSTTSTTALTVVKVGALFPLSGELALEGQSALKGMRLAMQEVNAAGGIASLDGALLTLVTADSKGDPGNAEPEVTRLVQREGVAALVGTGQSTVALDATAAAEKLEVPFLVSGGAADEITDRDLAYTFRLCPRADWYARDQVAFLQSLRSAAGVGMTAVALLHEKGEFGKQTAESQRAYLEAAGIQVVADIEYSAEAADIHNEVIAVRDSGAQALLTASYPSDAVAIAQAISALHLTLPVVDAGGGMADQTFIDAAGAAAEATMSVTEFAAGSVPARGLEAKFTVEGAQLDEAALYAYQAVWVLAAALERAGTITGPRLQVALRTTALSGEHLVLPQDLLTFDQYGQNRQAQLMVVQVQGGRLVAVWPRGYALGMVNLP